MAETVYQILILAMTRFRAWNRDMKISKEDYAKMCAIAMHLIDAENYKYERAEAERKRKEMHELEQLAKLRL